MIYRIVHDLGRGYARYLFYLLCAAAGFPAHSAVIGSVVDSQGGQPIAHAAVRAILLPGQEVVAETFTNADGKFRLESAPSGSYAISASKDGYLNLLPGHLAYAASAIAGESAVPLQLELTKSAVIAGNVIDGSGRPAISARVTPIVRRFVNGVVQFRPGTPSALVDDQGNYRLYGLAPGRYVIGVTPSGAGQAASVFLPAYFPGTSDMEKAEVIRLHAGETRRSVDFILSDTASYPVSGQVTGMPVEWAGRGVAVSLFSTSGYTNPLMTVQGDKEGRFQFESVPVGSYELVAEGPVIAIGGLGSVFGASPLFGRRHWDVTGPQTAGPEIALHGGDSLNGQLAVAGQGEPNSSCYTGAHVTLEPLDPIPPGATLTAAVSRAGTFELRMIAPGRYRISVGHLSSNCFLEEIQVGGQKVENRIVRSDASGQLTLLLTEHGSEVMGTVHDNNQPAAGAVVILAPTGASGTIRPEDARATVTSPDGRYHVTELAPGRYQILALRQVKTADYLNPAFWVDHKEQTMGIVLEAGGEAHADIKVLQLKEDWQ
ncbi:MAG TPA: carboxypeptidase-like regulatory domain-containing protein [Bryobacteraceae bacterium]|nr:carboxypeptidase-like regulatory domain-containing protein [Bryobacteraceae bacterium]